MTCGRTVVLSLPEMRALAAVIWPGAVFPHLQEGYDAGPDYGPECLEIPAPEAGGVGLVFQLDRGATA